MTRSLGLALAAGLALPAAAAPPPWTRYEVINWQDADAAGWAALAKSGVTAGKVMATRNPGHPIAPAPPALAASGLRWFIENIATDFYAPYHRWQPGHPVTWLMDRTRAAHAQGDPAALQRQPSLSDPAWQARIDARLAAHVAAFRSTHPLYYNLGDETGIADLSTAWDFDFSPVALAAFRTWLRGAYGSLAALNASWGASFATWDAVTPPTTDAALAGQNVPGWMDFKAWMDRVFADAVRAGATAVHAADPAARAAIEGVQLPGWGGYDYAQLAHTVDVMEISTADMEIMHGLAPETVLLTTVFGSQPGDVHRLWQALLHGARGVVLWEPPGPQVVAALAQLRGPGVARLLAAVPHYDPVAILYSQASFRLTWLLDRRAEGGWAGRDAEAELADNAWRIAFRTARRTLTAAGLQPVWITDAAALRNGRFAAVVLPHAIALSDSDVAALQDFAAHGGRILADTAPGIFDAHGRPRPVPLQAECLPGFAGLAAATGLAPAFAVQAPDGRPAEGLDIRVFDATEGKLIALQQAELGRSPRDVVLSLPYPAEVQDLLGGGVTLTDRLALRLDPARPALLAIRPSG